MFWREAPLARIRDRKGLVEWLRGKPCEVSVALAARMALRVLPAVSLESKEANYLDTLVSPVFRATGVAFAAATYPAQATKLSVNAHAAAVATIRVPTAGAAYRAAVAVNNYNRAAASATAASAAYAAHRAMPADARDAFWSAVSFDATGVEAGSAASDIAGSPPWPQGQPDQLRSLWQELKTTFHAAKQDWEVWTVWYDDRLDGRVRNEERELAYVRIDDALWNQGPAVVNAEIKRRIEEPPQHGVVQLQAHSSSAASMSAGVSLSVAEPAISAVPVDNPPIAGAAGQPRSEILAAWQSTDVAPQTPPAPRPFSPPSIDTPHPGRQYVPDFLPNPVALGAGGTPPAPIEAIPEQEPLATRFGVNSEGLIDVVPDPPAPGTAADPLQREFYAEIRLKAQSLVAVGPNQLGDLSGPANRFCDGLKDRIEDISITSLWSRGNTLRSRLKAHDLSMSNAEPDPARLPPLVAETLGDLVGTWNIFIVGDPKGRELDEMRLGPQEAEAARQVIAAAIPIVEAIEHSENVATPLAVEAVAEQAEAAKNALPGIHGDQAIDLSRKATGNFVAKIMQHVYVLARGEAAFAWEKGRAAIYAAGGPVLTYAAYNNWPAIVSFVARYADALKEFVTAAWHNPALVEIIDRIARTLL